MPLYRATHDEVVALVDALEADGYTCQVDSDDAGVYVMATKARAARGKAPAKETRG
jgi:hypothetical protein